MATVSARVDDQLKTDAERVADALGLPLSSAINIFLKRFSAERGFPFAVTVTDNMLQRPMFDKRALERAVVDAVSDPEYRDPSDSYAYFDSTKNAVVTKTITRRKE